MIPYPGAAFLLWPLPSGAHYGVLKQLLQVSNANPNDKRSLICYDPEAHQQRPVAGNNLIVLL